VHYIHTAAPSFNNEMHSALGAGGAHSFRYTFVFCALGAGGGGAHYIHTGATGAKFASFPSRRASEDQSGRQVVRGTK
jgi:hypothetical protein